MQQAPDERRLREAHDVGIGLSPPPQKKKFFPPHVYWKQVIKKYLKKDSTKHA